MMRDCPYPIGDLLPHKPPMVLLDKIIGWDKDRVEAEITIRHDSTFFIPGKGVPAHVGIEYMAQTCGAFAGLKAKETGDSVRIGFLLGTRQYRASFDWLAAGTQLRVSAIEIFSDGSMGVFDCHVFEAKRELASAQLSVYQPEDAGTVLKQRT